MATSKKQAKEGAKVEVTIPFDQLINFKKIGYGSFSIVYKVRHASWGCEVVYKKLKMDFLDPEEYKEESKKINGLRKEAAIHVNLRHSNIVMMMGIIFDEKINQYGLVLELVQHGSLASFLKKISTADSNSLPWLLKTKMAHEIASGMAYLHGLKPSPIIHGDLKTQNVLVTEYFNAKIADFGLSQWNEYVSSCSSVPKTSGTMVNIPPEKWKELKLSANEKYDVYGFSILLWELYTNSSAFEDLGRAGQSAQVQFLQLKIEAGTRPSMEKMPRDVPSAIADLIHQCWCQEPGERPNFSEDIITTLGSFVCGVLPENEIQRAKLHLHRTLESSTVETVALAKKPAEKGSKSTEAESAADSMQRPAGQHVFISYQWESMTAVLDLSKSLKMAGYRVWVDLQKMTIFLLEAMATAIENAAVVIVCMTQKYQESVQCRTEAEYASRLKKPIVPLRLQAGFKPDGWLGALQGSMVTHDFTESSNKKALRSLVSDLDDRGRNFGSAPTSDEVAPRHIKKINRVYQQLVDSLRRTDRILDTLLTKEFLAYHEYEDIKIQSGTYETVRRLLSVLLKKPYEVYVCFQGALKSTRQEHLYRLLEEKDFNLNVAHRAVLLGKYQELKDNIHLTGSKLLSSLEQNGVLDSQEVEDIKAKSTEREKIEQLISLLLRTSADQYDVFITLLPRADHRHVYDIFSTEKSSESTAVVSASERSSAGAEESAKSAPEVQHVFISYQWDSKPAVLALSNSLKAEGYRVWVDLYSKAGPSGEEMANAVENAAVVIVCLTQKYKESSDRRREAEYAFRLRKSVVPLRLEAAYISGGWLNAIMDNKLIHDFTQPSNKKALRSVIRDLGDRGRGNGA